MTVKQENNSKEIVFVIEHFSDEEIYRHLALLSKTNYYENNINHAMHDLIRAVNKLKGVTSLRGMAGKHPSDTFHHPVKHTNRTGYITFISTMHGQATLFNLFNHWRKALSTHHEVLAAGLTFEITDEVMALKTYLQFARTNAEVDHLLDHDKGHVLFNSTTFRWRSVPQASRAVLFNRMTEATNTFLQRQGDD